MWKNSSIYLIKLIDQLEALPSIGRKTAQRLAYHILQMPEEKAKALASSILDAHSKIHCCSICCNFTDKEICNLCLDKSRNNSVICVVEDPKDIDAIEKTHEFDGLYHVLHGVISPLNGIGPDEIKITQLLDRLKSKNILEIIMATNPTVEGEATAMYISKLLKGLDIKVTRLAYGIPVGATLEYADEITLSRAILGRSEFI